MTNDKKMLEINQRREGGRYLPPRDTFLLSVQGDVISAEAMGEKEFAKCFNPSNLSLSIVGEKKKDGYVVYDQDYTKVNFSNTYSPPDSSVPIFFNFAEPKNRTDDPYHEPDQKSKY